MPIYEYRCNNCKSLCDITHKMDDEPFIKCHLCGKKMKRMMSAPAFILPVYRPAELVNKRDSETKSKELCERDYRQKLSSSLQ